MNWKKILDKALFQLIFDVPIMRVDTFNPALDNTNDVYLVVTEKKQYIVKALKDSNSAKNTFWYGLYLLFGATLETSIRNQKTFSEYLKKHVALATPRVYQADWSFRNALERPYVVMEKMSGKSVTKSNGLADFISQSEEAARQLGRFLGQLHQHSYRFFGTIKLNGFPLEDFPTQLRNTINILAKTPRAMANTVVQEQLSYYLAEAEQLISPISATFIRLDLEPTQFLATDTGLAALIDLEGYVIGPVELELARLEIWLKNLSVFKEEYLASGLKWPDFEKQRALYRFFLYLLHDCPEEGLKSWIEAKGKFPQEDRVKRPLTTPRPNPYLNLYNPFDGHE